MKKFEWIKSDKFNTNQLSICMQLPLDELEINYAVLSQVICSLSEKYNTKNKVILHSNNLYGSLVKARHKLRYKVVTLTIDLLFPNPKYLNDDKIIDELFSFLEEMMYHPLLNENKNGFDEKNFNEILRKFKDGIDALHDNKDNYSFNKLVNYMQRDDEVYIPKEFTLEDYNSINNEHIYNLYKRFITESDCYVVGMGNIDKELVEKKVNTLNLPVNDYNFEYFDNYLPKDIKEDIIVEKENIKQSRIVIGLRTDIVRKHRLYPALQLMITMFGGNFISTLSNIIREDMSIAYSIYSFINVNRNSAYVIGGVENNNVDNALNIIKNELLNYQNGNVKYAKELLNVAKEEYQSNYNSLYDIMQGYLYDLSLKFTPYVYTKEELYRLTMNTTLDDIYEASKHLFIDKIFILKGENND